MLLFRYNEQTTCFNFCLTLLALHVALFDVAYVEWRLLVDIIVYPVAVKQVGRRAPSHLVALLRVVVAIIMLRQRHVVAFAEVTVILVVERVGRVFQVAEYVEVAAMARADDADAGLGRLGYDVQLWHLLYVGLPHLGMA